MMSGDSLIAQSESFVAMTTGASVLDALQDTFAAFGATHFLVSGMPFPGRPIDPLLLRLNWGELNGERRSAIKGSDPVLQLTIRKHRPLFWSEAKDGPLEADSLLLANLGSPGARQLLLVPICSFLPYQGAIVGGGVDLDIDAMELMAIDYFCIAAFNRLFKLGEVRPERPGELSGRERTVVELSAGGKTAGEIAAILAISQRTVHAHLQNASEKLRALNKTQTVVEALRYGQITV